MRARHKRFLPEGVILLVIGVLFAACSSGGGSPVSHRPAATPSAPAATSSSSPATCANQASAKAEAWVANNQVIGSINGGPQTTLSNFVYPLGLPDEGQFGPDQLSALVWSPDTNHLAVVVTSFQPMQQVFYPYVVDTSTHAVTRVTLPNTALLSGPNEWNPWRLLAWADNQTLLIFAAGSSGGSENKVSYSYDLSSGTVSPLPGVTSAAEGVVRSSTLFYLDLTPPTQMSSTNLNMKGAALLHRYNLSRHTEVGAPIRLSETFSARGSEGNIIVPGWDASPDGTRITYEQLTVTQSADGSLMETAPFFAANADGGAATSILTGATPQQGIFPSALLAISPNGLLVAVTHADAMPDVLSGNISGGPAHFYTPSVAGPPTWLANNCNFEADMGASPGSGIERFALNTGTGAAQGFIAIPNASAPAVLA